MPLIRQSAAAECGLACLAMIAGFHGRRYDLTTLRRNHEISLKGATLDGLIRIADELNLSTRALRCELEHLDDLRLPAILHWNLDHFVVLESVSKRGINLFDPGAGKRFVPFEEVDKSFTGVALELQPNRDFQKRKEKTPLALRSLFMFDRTSIRPIFQAIGLTVFLQVFVLIGPYFIQLIVDRAIFTGDAQLVILIAGAFAALKLFEVTTVILRRLVFQLLGKILTFDLKAGLFHHLVRLPIKYFTGRGIGDVQQRFNSVEIISRFIVDGMIEAVIDGLLAVVLCIVLFHYNSTLGFVVSGFLLSFMILRLIALRVSQRLSMDEAVTLADESSLFLETMRGMQTIKVAGIEVAREGLWRNTATRRINAEIRLGNLKIGFDSLIEGTLGVSNIVVIAIAALAVIDGNLTIGALTAFLAYKDQFERRSVSLFDKWIEYRLLEVHLERIADIALSEREARTISPAKPIDLKGGLILNDLTFRYAPLESDILSNISMSIESGEFIALAGPSGHGKSTLLRMMIGLYQPTRGEVLYDGVPASAFNMRSLRQQLGVVLQDDTLMAGSIGDNICLFDPSPDQERIEWAAETACIHDDINRMPMGYHSLVGDMGTTLSGGQQQRVMIARALYRKPKILIMDEGTSQLDVQTELRINEALADMNITRIVAAHRPDTIRKADRVFHVLFGTVTDLGSIDDLPAVSVVSS